MMANSNGNGEHWLIKGLGGVNVVTLILIVLGGAKLYFELDKDIALMKHEMAQINRTLTSIQSAIGRAERPLYSYPPSITRSVKPGGKS